MLIFGWEYLIGCKVWILYFVIPKFQLGGLISAWLGFWHHDYRTSNCWRSELKILFTVQAFWNQSFFLYHFPPFLFFFYWYKKLGLNYLAVIQIEWNQALASKMAAGTEYPPPLSVSEEGYGNGNVTALTDDKAETVESMEVANMGRPPRQLPPICRSVSSAQLESTTDMVRKFVPSFFFFL